MSISTRVVELMHDIRPRQALWQVSSQNSQRSDLPHVALSSRPAKLQPPTSAPDRHIQLAPVSTTQVLRRDRMSRIGRRCCSSSCCCPPRTARASLHDHLILAPQPPSQLHVLGPARRHTHRVHWVSGTYMWPEGQKHTTSIKGTGGAEGKWTRRAMARFVILQEKHVAPYGKAAQRKYDRRVRQLRTSTH